jgi:dolichol-phosphate mannosyltransferase
MKITILVPVRNEVENLPELKRRLNTVIDDMVFSKIQFQVIVNDNFSNDGSAEFLRAWAENDERISINFFRRDVGFQKSILIGMRQANGDALIVLQSDLQDPPEMLVDFINIWMAGAKVVGGIIVKRYESFISRSMRKFYYRFLNWSSEYRITPNFQDFYLLDASVYQQLQKLNFNYAFLRAEISAKYGIESTISYLREDRKAGKSKFGFAKKYALGMDGLLLYGLRLNRLISVSSFLAVICFFFTTLLLSLSSFFGVKVVNLKFFLLVSLVLFGFSSIILMGSIVIEYLARLYNMSVRSEEIEIF